MFRVRVQGSAVLGGSGFSFTSRLGEQLGHNGLRR